jgi:predicted short-subunit dehydrogenase-like oxidoreductase (DUF2520 family)
MKRIVIIGSGNVAGALAGALCREGMPPVQIWARNGERAARVAAECGCPHSDVASELAPADLYIVAVADKAIKTVTAKLDFGDAVVAHTAGSVGLGVFPPQVKHRAVIYPLQTFTRGRRVELMEVPILIEGSTDHALKTVGEVAGALSTNVSEVDSRRRMTLHTAAVFANNFANHMFVAGEELAREAGYDFEILKPLIVETVDKALAAASPREVQTGPAVRNDFETRSRHVELLGEKPYLQNIYITISKNIWETSKKT